MSQLALYQEAKPCNSVKGSGGGLGDEGHWNHVGLGLSPCFAISWIHVLKK